jgi:D-3-phosphoglycerate dehydrogenase
MAERLIRNRPPFVHSVTSSAGRQGSSTVTMPIVLIAEELSPATVDALGPDFEIRRCDGANRDELLTAIVDVDAVLVRSATKIDAEALDAAKRLTIVARAGVGLDNVDVKAATQAGVMVVNAPTSNIVSAAELAIALLLAVARHVPQADASLKSGQWKRSAYTGTELYEKTLGLVGLGRIGALMTTRLAAFGMDVVAYDPYISAARAGQLGVRLVGLDELMAESDFISIHLPRTPETIGLIGEQQLRQAKPGMRIVNAARGGIVDEAALYAALSEGRIAGAGLDVFDKEPCTDSPIFGLPNVVVTPHLGASASSCRTPSTCPAGSSTRRSGPASRSPSGSAASSPRCRRACRRTSTSRSAARSRRSTSACCASPRSRACSPTSSRRRSRT